MADGVAAVAAQLLAQFLAVGVARVRLTAIRAVRQDFEVAYGDPDGEDVGMRAEDAAQLLDGLIAEVGIAVKSMQAKGFTAVGRGELVRSRRRFAVLPMR